MPMASFPMNFKERVRAFFLDTNGFPYHDLECQEDKNAYRQKIVDFLDAKTFGEAENGAIALKEFLLDQHSKFDVFETALHSLNAFEKSRLCLYDQQRLHFVHRANVFLIGLYLYGNFPKIQTAINAEMRRNSKLVYLASGAVCRFSGDTEAGEFLFRWRMASVVNDLGYIFSLPGANNRLFNDVLDIVGSVLNKSLHTVDDLVNFEGRNLLLELDRYIFNRKKISLIGIVKHLRKHPFKEAVYYDQGIFSALIFLRLINQAYKNRQDASKPSTQSTLATAPALWPPVFLRSCFPHIAMAVALHGIEIYRDDLESKSGINIQSFFDVKNHPFYWLLKISNLLQEWDKPASEGFVEENLVDSRILDFQMDDNGDLEILMFPKGIAEQKAICGFSNAPLSISFRQ